MKSKYNWAEIQALYDSGLTQRQIIEKFKMSFRTIRLATARGDFKSRSRSAAGKLSNLKTKRSVSNETKEKISIAMKKCHAEGRAWNIGKSRWNNEPSWPEKFFMNVINNEFKDKAVFREYPMGNFSLDFAWPHLKKCIEIDGDQHQRFEEYKLRDQRKDAYIEDAGWKVLRIKWKDLFNDPKTYIEIAKQFLN